MSRLVIITGARGAGKSFLIKKWLKHDNKAVPIKKFVSETRAPREIEIKTGQSDLIFDRKYDPKTVNGENWYAENNYQINTQHPLLYHDIQFSIESLCDKDTTEYNDAYYKIDINSIDKAIQEGKNPIIIVRGYSAIEYLLSLYDDALVIYVQSMYSGEDLVKRLMELGEPETVARKRLKHNDESLRDYTENIQRLPNYRVVINDYNGDEGGALYSQLKKIYDDDVCNYTSKSSESGANADYIPKSIFVIESYKEADDEEGLTIFDCAKNAALEVFKTSEYVHSSSQRKNGSYMIDINVYHDIDSHDCIICDVTNDRCSDCDKEEPSGRKRSCRQGTSSNVWFELGYAIKTLRSRGVNLDSRLIVSSKSSADLTELPVDIGGSGRIILYYNTKKQLQEELVKILKNIYEDTSAD